MIIFGLSYVNLLRLREGKPITFRGEDVGLSDVEFLIFSGETEQFMAREMSDLVGPNTATRIDPKVTDA